MDGRKMNGGNANVPVVWVADGDSDFCAGCSSAFTLTLRKHSCRMCGSSFCQKCSSAKRPVPWRGHPEPVRVCDMCVQALDRMKKVQRVRAALGTTEDTHGHGKLFVDEQERMRRERNDNIMEALKRIYNAKIRPLEQAFKFGEFYNSDLTEGDFDAKPMVLLVGQYSVGKTSFIKFLLERDFPGQRIGPEPTTDRFVAVMHGRSDRCVPGNAAAVDPQRPFSSLGRFGTAFLNRFEVSELQAPILEALSFVDTPGILSGEKQRLDRGYNFEEVVQWYAERADRILILFDAHKLDISDELKRTIQILKSHEDKIRIVLNKADMVEPQQLMRVYGALMWSLGKVVKSPEVIRVYLGSFWDKPLAKTGAVNNELFAAEKKDLISDLMGLPSNAAVRKVNELVKRARLAKVHALLVSHLWSSMPYFWGASKKQQKLVGRLDQEYKKVSKLHDLAPGDFPPIEKFKAGLERFEISEFQALSQRLVDVCDVALSKDIPNLILRLQGMEMKADATLRKQANNMPPEQKTTPRSTINYDIPDSGRMPSQALPASILNSPNLSHHSPPSPSTSLAPTSAPVPTTQRGWDDGNEEHGKWGSLETTDERADNPFADFDETPAEEAWIVSQPERMKWANSFHGLGPSGSPPTVTGSQARKIMLSSGLPNDSLKKIWDLSDTGARGRLDEEEFVLAMFLVTKAKIGEPLPNRLPPEYIPPSKRP